MPRRELSISEKIAVLNLMKKQPNTSQRRLAAITGIPKSTIARIALQKHKILHESTLHEEGEERRLLSQAKRKEKRGDAKYKDPDVEEVLNKLYSITEPVTGDYPDGSEMATKPKPASESHPAAFSFSQHLFLTEPIDMDLQMEQEEKLEDTFLEERRQMALIESILLDSQPSPADSEMEKKQDLKVAAPPPPVQPAPPLVQPAPNQTSSKRKAVDQSSQGTASDQPAPNQSTPKRMAADETSPGKIAAAKPPPPVQSAPHQAQLAPTQAPLWKMAATQVTARPLHSQKSNSLSAPASAQSAPVAKPKTSHPQKKRLLVVSNHQQCVMSSLASLWKSGKFCDAGLGNGSTTVKVHKVILSAVCPKLLSMFSEEFFSQKFLQVNFPKEVTKEALMAFGEYIYRGVLYLDNDILEQLKIIAKRLDNKELVKLCDRHLQSNTKEPAASLTNFSSVQTAPPAKKASTISPSSTSSINTPSTKTVSITSFAPPISLSPTSSINTPVGVTTQEISKEKTSLVPGQKVEVITLAPNWSAIATDRVVIPSIKAELVRSEDHEYGVWNTTSCHQSYVSVPSSTSSSSKIVSASSSNVSASSLMEEFTIPFSKRAETPDSSPVSSVAEKVGSKSNIDVSERLSRSSDLTSLVDNSLTDKVYPVELSTAGGDILPLQTVHVKPELYEMDFT